MKAAGFWATFMVIGALAELVAIAGILVGRGDRTFSTWVRDSVPLWVVCAVSAWFVLHTGGPKQGTPEALATTGAAFGAAWLTMRVMVGG